MAAGEPPLDGRLAGIARSFPGRDLGLQFGMVRDATVQACRDTTLISIST